jgi:GT2 family glycosyltransferase
MLKISAIVPATDDPKTLRRCLDAIELAEEPPQDVIVVDGPLGAGAAEARNDGARRATGEILAFVDADVVVHPDSFLRIRAAFARDDGLTALFGSYDDAPAQLGVVSVFRNLLHHYIHQASPGPASTFWTGLGAIRRQAFAEVGGFDERLATMEDVDLGMRVCAAGGSIVLDPQLQGKHLKRWTLGQMIRTDFSGRGVPWVVLLARNRASSRALNLGWQHRASALACLLALGGLVARRPRVSAASLVAFVALNRRFYALLLRRQGPPAATLGVGLHFVHVLTSVAAVPVGLAVAATRPMLRRLRRRAIPSGPPSFPGRPPVRLLALLAVRDGMRYLPGFVANVAPQVDGIIALDDGSRDGSAEFLAETPSVIELLRVPTDRPVWDDLPNHRALVHAALRHGAEWIICVDVDERLELEFRQRAHRVIQRGRVLGYSAYAVRLRDLWDSPNAYRVDGIWGQKTVARLFRARADHEFDPRPLHGQKAPLQARRYGRYPLADLNVYHLGMLHRDDRLARRRRWELADPDNRWQAMGYAYLTDERGRSLATIDPRRGYTE